eukprot:363306-Chlamydomonas_euryale.AAC.3
MTPRLAAVCCGRVTPRQRWWHMFTGMCCQAPPGLDVRSPRISAPSGGGCLAVSTACEVHVQCRVPRGSLYKGRGRHLAILRAGRAPQPPPPRLCCDADGFQAPSSPPQLRALAIRAAAPTAAAAASWAPDAFRRGRDRTAAARQLPASGTPSSRLHACWDGPHRRQQLRARAAFDAGSTRTTKPPRERR